ncbi:MAG: DUF896 domain-containing protein [Clostridia bacterium]|nr:DUF896 domain-containing protein [Clostridia bacterium]
MTKAKIDRINALAHKAKTPEGLTALEKAEQARLRKEYIAAFRASTEAALSRIEIQNPDGTVTPLKKKD